MSDPEGSTVLYEADGGIAAITLNRPHARNALSTALQRDLVAAFDRASGDNDVRVVILTGAGNAFCAGVDLKEFGRLDGNADARHAETAWDAMSRCAKPIIGAVNGPAITGGFEIALACDVLIASVLVLLLSFSICNHLQGSPSIRTSLWYETAVWYVPLR